MSRNHYSREDLKSFFDKTFLQDPDIRAGESKRPRKIAFLMTTWPAEPKMRLKEHINAQLLSGIKKSTENHGERQVDELLFSLAKYEPAYDYFIRLLETPENEWIDAALFEASASNDLAINDLVSGKPKPEETTLKGSDEQELKEQKPIYRAAFSYNEFELELLKEIRIRSQNAKSKTKNEKAATLGQRLAINGYSVSKVFEFNKFMAQRAAEHWVTQQKVRRSLKPLFEEEKK